MSRRRKSGKISSVFSVFIGFIALYLLVTYWVFFAIAAAVFLIVWITIKLVDMKKTKKAEEERWKMQKNFAVIDQMDGHEFEWFVAKILAKIGFQNVQVTKASGDYGVDVIAYSNGVKYAIQCKRYSGKLGLKPVQEVHSGMAHYGATVGAVVTNSYFTENAKRLAKETGINLWDRDVVNYMITEIDKAQNNPAATKTDEVQTEETDTEEVVCLTEKENLMEGFEMARIGAGKYLFGEDLPLGKYDLTVVSGSGALRIQTGTKVDKDGEYPEKYIWLSEEEEDGATGYRGISLPQGWYFTLDDNVIVEIRKSKMLVID